MQVSVNTYIPKNTPIHTCDARVKLVLLLAYSIALFLVQTWIGMGLLAAACLIVWALSKIEIRAFLAPLIPLYILLAATLIFNAFTFDISNAGTSYGGGGVYPESLGSFEPVALIGTFGFVPDGLMRGLFYAIRIFLLVFMSLVVSFSTSSTELMDAFRRLLTPLRALKAPVEDIAMMASIALRFIPITAEELHRVQVAQRSRGADFEKGSVFARLRIWNTVLVPLFVGLFRRADNLALAMESRCYGLGFSRTSLHGSTLTYHSLVAMGLGVLICVSIAFIF